jgi:hypothetical protein
MKLFKVHKNLAADNYVIPLKYPQWNQDRIVKAFHKDYSDRTRVLFNTQWAVNEELKSVVPLEVLDHMWKSPVVVHYHKHRPTKMFVPIHIDGLDGVPECDFKAAINMPVIGCDEKCLTNFWNAPDGYTYKEKAKGRPYESGFLETAIEYCMTDQPILFNTKELHSTVNYNDWERERCIISWRFKEYISWEDTKDMLREYIQPIPQMTNLVPLG